MLAQASYTAGFNWQRRSTGNAVQLVTPFNW
jgi:hypothetical protein